MSSLPGHNSADVLKIGMMKIGSDVGGGDDDEEEDGDGDGDGGHGVGGDCDESV